MQYVIILALLYFLFFSSSKKKKQAQRKQQNDKAACVEQPADAPEEIKASEAAVSLEKTAKPEAQAQHDAPDLFAYMQAQADSANTAPDAPMSAIQGETPEEHAAHDERMQARERAEARRAEDARQRKNAARQRLREAVVMREILDKPVSLRGRRML